MPPPSPPRGCHVRRMLVRRLPSLDLACVESIQGRPAGEVLVGSLAVDAFVEGWWEPDTQAALKALVAKLGK